MFYKSRNIKDCQQIGRPGRGLDRVSLVPEETSSSDTLTQTSGHQDCEKINLLFKLPRTWDFVTAATANGYIS